MPLTVVLHRCGGEMKSDFVGVIHAEAHPSMAIVYESVSKVAFCRVDLLIEVDDAIA